jgi:CBS domain-containing protein
MHAQQIMTRRVVTTTEESSIADAAKLMLQERISGLPVMNGTGKLVGIVSEGDFLQRTEIGTKRRRAAWIEFFTGPGKLADEFVHQEGRRVSDVMTKEPITVDGETSLTDIVDLMERKGIKRLPVVRGDELVGIVTRANLLQAVANLSRDVPDPTADDDHLRHRILMTIEKQLWRPIGLNAVVRNGIVDLSGIITDDRQRQAAVTAARNFAGVKGVHDHLCWVESMSGYYIGGAEDAAEKQLKASQDVASAAGA